MSERPNRRGPAPAHSRAEIAAAAIDIADAGGLEAVTMRALANEFGTGGGSLYRYVASRDDLLDLMVDAVMVDLDLTGSPSGDPVADLVDLGRRLLTLYRRHPWVPDARPSVSTPGPRVLDVFERALALLEPVPSATAIKMEAIAMVIGVVTLFARQESTTTKLNLRPDTDGRHHRLAVALGMAGEVATGGQGSGSGVDPAAGPSPDGARQDLFGRVLAGVVQGVLA